MLLGRELHAAKLVLLCAIANGTPMACDPQSLLNQANCLLCKLPSDDEVYDAVELVLLCAIRDATPISCDPDNLLSQARCILCTIPAGAMKAAKLGVLCDIAN
jgi:hypothetical protein